jgi:dTDP-4-dehydrorhamnose reductase
MKKILITGASGMVGYAMCHESIKQGLNVVGAGRQDRHRISGVRFCNVELTNEVSLTDLVKKSEPDFIINLAANTDHQACEQDPDTAYKLHVETARLLASLASTVDARLITISSEAVYGDLGPGPHTEHEICKPHGIYAATKKGGEEQVIANNSEALVIRCTPVGIVDGEHRSLAGWLYNQLKQGHQVTGYEDWIFSPVSTRSLARLILDPRLDGLAGVFNWGVDESISKLAFVRGMASALGYDASLIAAGHRFDNGTFYDVSLDSGKLARKSGIKVPGLRELFEDFSADAALIEGQYK